MDRRTWLSIVALIAVLGIGFVGWKVLGPAQGPRTAARPTASDPEPTVESSGPAVTAPARVVEEPTTDALRAAGESARAPAVAGSVELEGALWIEGRVDFPPGTPDDERAVVVGQGRRFETIGHHRAPVAADGTFRVAFPQATKRCRLVLEARYAYASSYELDLRRPPAEIVIEPELGGLVTAVLHAPASLRPDDPAPETVRLNIYLGRGARSTTASQRDGSFAFELGGVPPSSGCRLHTAPEGWTEIIVGGVEVRGGERQHHELAAELGVQIRGRVVDSRGVGIPGVGLTVDGLTQVGTRSRKKTTAGRTEEDGSFALLGVPPGALTLRAELKGFIGTEVELGEQADRARVHGVRVELDRGLTIAGRVEWPGGAGVAEARVRVEPEVYKTRGRGAQNLQTKTAEDGTFEISGLEAGSFRVTASGALPAPPEKESLAERRSRRRARWFDQVENVEAGTADLALVLETGRSLSGTVADENGTPLDSFSVQYHRTDSAGHADGRVRRFEESGGRFTLEGLVDGTWSLAASSEEHAPGPPQIVSIPEESGPVRLVAQRGVTVSGLVVDTAGRPVPKAHVRARVRADLTYDAGRWGSAQTYTDEDGRYELAQLGPGRLFMACDAPGYSKSPPFELELHPGERRTGVTTTLVMGGRIEGRLHPREGLRLQEQQVTVQSEGGYWKYTSTDRAGQFVFVDVPPGRVTLQCTHERGADAVEAEVVEDRTVEVVLGLPKKGGIRVFGAVTCAGQPVEGVQVSVRAEQELERVVTDAFGDYELVVDSPGEYDVVLRQAGFSHFETVQILEAADQRFDFVLSEGSIAGRVLAPDGHAIVDLTVIVSGASSGSMESDADGGFRFVGLSPGRYRLDVLRWSASSGLPPYTTPALQLELGTDESLEGVVLQLEEPCRVEGRVTTDDGTPSIGAHVHLTADDEQNRQPVQVRTDATGGFRAYVEEGRWEVVARKDRLLSSPSTVEARTGATSRLELVLESGTIVQVVLDGVSESIVAELTGANGRRYSSLRIVQPEEGASIGGAPRGWRVGPVPPGTYRVVARRTSSKANDAEGTVRLDGEPFREVVLGSGD